MDASLIVGLIATMLEALGFLLVARALTSWFPNLRQYQVVQLLYEITDPIIEPMRKLIPPIGMLDLSVMITVFALFMLAGALKGAV